MEEHSIKQLNETELSLLYILNSAKSFLPIEAEQMANDFCSNVKKNRYDGPKPKFGGDNSFSAAWNKLLMNGYIQKVPIDRSTNNIHEFEVQCNDNISKELFSDYDDETKRYATKVINNIDARTVA